jgi:hypothetical protein
VTPLRVALLICVVVLGMLSVEPAAFAGSRRVRLCDGADLQGKSLTPGTTAGSSFATVRVTHPDPGRCGLRGSPRVLLLDGTGRRLAAVTGSASGVRSTLAYGGRSFFSLGWVSVNGCSTEVWTFLAKQPGTHRGWLRVPLIHPPLNVCLSSAYVLDFDAVYGDLSGPSG